jgi:hypothetical protein
MANKMKWVLTICLVALGVEAGAADPAAVPADCADIAPVKSKSRQSYDGSTLMTNLLLLEKQGEANFRPSYSSATSECAWEKFASAGSQVTAVYSPFEKGEHTLLYRFLVPGSGDSREILVMYDAMASLVAKKGDIFFVIENRRGNIAYYAMYRDQPTYEALKPLVVSILDGGAKPLASVHWPPGGKEPVIDAYDSDRLK